MPKLLVHETSRHYGVPSSPFQKLVHAAMQKKSLSGRALAALMTKAGAKTSQSTIWIWLHTPNGHPHPKSFQASHALALVKVLGLPKQRLLEALDASRHLYTAKEDPTPAAAHDGLAALEEIISAGKTTYVRRSYVLNRIRLIRDGCRS